mgnify:FL=1
MMDDMTVVARPGAKAKATLVSLGFLLILTAVCYGFYSTEMGGYSDDLSTGIMDREQGIVKLFTWEVFEHHPRPIQWLILAPFYHLLFDNWAAMHAVCLLAHLLSVFLFGLLLLRWTRSSLGTLFGTMLPALHPGINILVYWPNNLGKLMATVFITASLLSITSFAEKKRGLHLFLDRKSVV